MKVIVLTGPESSGKSSLAREIQLAFGGDIIGEYVRYFIEQNQRETCYYDVDFIAKGQLEWEDRGRLSKPDLLILDTHLLSNILWGKFLFSTCPSWIEPALLSRSYDLHFLLDPNGVTWMPDGQRCQPDISQRQNFYNSCKSWLQESGKKYIDIGGSWDERRKQIIDYLESWL